MADKILLGISTVVALASVLCYWKIRAFFDYLLDESNRKGEERLRASGRPIFIGHLQELFEQAEREARKQKRRR
jgi:hypothetical protein